MADTGHFDTRQLSYSRVLQVLREQRTSSRAELARRTGLSPATVTTITRDLMERGYLREGGVGSSKGGRPPILLEYNARSRLALGLDLHEFAVSGVVTDLYAQALQSHKLEPVQDGPEAVIAALARWVEGALESVNPDKCRAIGIAIPGLVDPKTGALISASEFGLPSMPLADALEDRIGLRPVLTNRTPAAALAERWLGAAREAENVLFIRLGGYIGGTILIDGLPYWGAGHGVAAIAHMTVDPEGAPCRCGSRGCLDTVASGASIARSAREAIKAGRSSGLAERTSDNLDMITAEMVVEEARRGDAVALAVLQEAGSWLGLAVANCINLLGPDMVVIGGGVGRAAGDLLLDPVRETVRNRAVWAATKRVRIVSTSLGPEATACGAAATAILATMTRSIELHVT